MLLSRKILAATMALAGMFATALPGLAQQTYPGGPGVATVSVANGNVTIVRADSGQQAGATVNAPLLPGDYVATGGGSTAEVQFDGVSMLRLAPNTQVRLISLDPNSREVQLATGTADLAALQGTSGSPQVDTPSLTVRANQSGDYRVSVLQNGQTLVTARSGAATIGSGAGSQVLTPGTTLVAYGPYSNPSIQTQGAIGYDSFDQFNNARDQSVASAYNSNPYLAPQLAGYSNLANYGQWQNVPGYGYAWAPNNQTNYAPYQNGQWVWEPGYGYTWVDNQPWGYATSHYGNWFNNSSYGGWLWQPPSYQNQSSSSSLASSWLPALVTFFLSGGNGGSGNLNYNNANIGWIPLAPGEQYQPWYGQNASYPPTSMTNVTNISQYYTNARYYRGVTMVPVSAWRNGNFRNARVVRPQELRQIQLVRGAIPVVPTTANLYYTRTAVRRPVALSRTFVTPRFAAKAPAVTHLRFATQQAQIKAIVSQRPKIVPPPVHLAVTHPVYHPVAHPSVRALTIAKPAPFAQKQPAAPVHATAPRPVHAAAPVQHAATPHPANHAPAQAIHTVAPRPVTHTTAPRQVTHTAEPRPVTHTAAPVQHIATPRPVNHPPAQAIHTVAPRPVTHTAAPLPVTQTAPPVKHIAAPPPVTHAAPPPVTHAAPPVTHAPPPVTHAPPPPVTHAAPARPPVVPVAAPHPVTHAPAPVTHPATAPVHTTAHPHPATTPKP